jgi:hypothetical protein
MALVPKEVAVGKLTEVIERGRASTRKSLEDIVREHSIRKDFIARPEGGFSCLLQDGKLVVSVGDDLRQTYSMTDHAEEQLLSKAGLPKNYKDHLIRIDETGLLTHSLDRLLKKTAESGVMMRRVGDTIKGVLSPSYRRMDASPIFGAFVSESVTAGFVPYRGAVTDTRYVLSFLKPDILEPIPGDFCVFGVQIRTSDYGFGAMQFNIFVLRVICVNLATGLNLFRKIHIGRRIEVGEDDADVIDISERTASLDVETVASAVRDATRSSVRYFAPLAKAIEGASSDVPDVSKALQDLKKKGLKKDLLEKVHLLYESPMPVEILPPEPSSWRLANTLSFLANGESGDDRLALEDASFQILIGGRELKAA